MNDAAENTASTVKKTVSNQQKQPIILLSIFGFLSVAMLFYLAYSLVKVNEYLGSINQLEVSAANIVKDVNDAAFAKDLEISKQAHAKLQTDIQNYELALRSAQKNATDNKAIFKQLQEKWQGNKEKIEYVLTHSNDVNALKDIQEAVAKSSKAIQQDYQQASEQAVLSRMPMPVVSEMQSQILKIERISNELTSITNGTEGSADTFKKQVREFADVLARQQQEYASRIPILNSIASAFKNTIAPVSDELETLNNPAIKSRANARALSDLGTQTHVELKNIDRDILTRPKVIIPAIGFVISLLAFFFMLSQLLKNRSHFERRLTEKETLRQRQEMEVEAERSRKIQEENERNQMAILRLLDELGDLAEGDLTVNATVSEDFTGAIADSVNFAIDQLRQLVLAINTTADRIARSSEQTQRNAVELAEASEHQAQEIASVSAAINEMAVSIDQVSANATESAAVAQRSVAIAHNGAEVVQRSIEGMNTIREQIQETSKRIKRLGESSQEIGDIVSLINDIADQTNVLALNAAIQASMAGEAGRGFAVVADEVQRLAERSANATKQIETLVKTIQADTNEAVMSMESTTAEVVRGAKLAKDAGEALEEVQSVSHTLADLIQSISSAASQQASSAGHISNTMNIIQDITSQTSSGTMATARSVGQLNEMSAALQESVSGFKLSDDDVILVD